MLLGLRSMTRMLNSRNPWKRCLIGPKMADPEIDLLAIDRGSITAPAGCGKTHLIAEALQRHEGEKPILVLTHTNAGVAALRSRMDKAGVSPKTLPALHA